MFKPENTSIQDALVPKFHC